jgi:hypothetical protein
MGGKFLSSTADPLTSAAHLHSSSAAEDGKTLKNLRVWLRLCRAVTFVVEIVTEIAHVGLMRGTPLAPLVLSIFAASCSGATALSPTAASVAVPGPTAVEIPATTLSGREIQGTLGPFDGEAQPCFANLFPCEVFDFTLSREGPIEVTISWQGNARALFVQLYWQGQWLAHEDVAPREGPSQISFLRPRMEANDYQLRIVSREPTVAIPFRLMLRY